MNFRSLLFCCLFFLTTQSWFAQTRLNANKPLTRILFIYDASNSMNGKWQSSSKNEIAKNLLIKTLDSLNGIPNVQLALRVYGHQKHFPPQDCDDSKLEVPFSNGNIPQIKSKLNGLKPKGTTPIAMSLEEAGNDFPECGDCRNIIILITDGIEECDGDPCAISYLLQQRGIILKPFVIGIGLDPMFKKSFECIGNYFDATSEASFEKIMGVVVSQVLNNTTTQINLLDFNGQPNETNVNMTLYNHFTGKPVHNFVHTMNHRGVPDTLKLDASMTYDVQVHTIPSVRKDSITITPGIHNVVGIDCPQGDLRLKLDANGSNKNLTAIVRKDGEMKTLNVQNFGSTERYLVGKYDLEVLSLPRVYINDILVTQSHTTKIEIPEPGVAHIVFETGGYGSLYTEKKGKLELIYRFDQRQTQKTLVLQPGKYRVVFRAKNAKESIFSAEKSFKIKSGESTTVKLF
ncbi:MAG: VWA domain-containing protein [Flavobacteriales bacterium]|nr:VWA domain-containing protein [Flavobacteriales bacterium]